MIPGRQKNRKPRLRETTPVVLQNVALEKNPLRILQFKMIFDDERASGKHCRFAHPLGKIAMRVDQGEPPTGGEVATCERLNQGRFADAGLADRIDMRQAVGLPDAEADRFRQTA